MSGRNARSSTPGGYESQSGLQSSNTAPIEGSNRRCPPSPNPARNNLTRNNLTPGTGCLIRRSGGGRGIRCPGRVRRLTSMRPPWRRTISWEIERPRPVPSPTGLVVKNGIEDALEVLGRDAATTVGDRDLHLAVDHRGAHAQHAEFVDRLDRRSRSRFRNTCSTSRRAPSTSGISPYARSIVRRRGAAAAPRRAARARALRSGRSARAASRRRARRRARRVRSPAVRSTPSSESSSIAVPSSKSSAKSSLALSPCQTSESASHCSRSARRLAPM